MRLSYAEKRSVTHILQHTAPAMLQVVGRERHESPNMLIKGDNLRVMQGLLIGYGMRGKIDLVYIDPPFSTNAAYKHNEKRTATVSASASDETAYLDRLKGASFIEFLRERLVLIRELMADRGSIYLHTDYKIGHYVKIVMDEIFGATNFCNDITRIKCNPKNFTRKGYGNIKDLILFYTKTDDFTWNEPREDMTDEDAQRLFAKVDEHGRKYTTTPLHAPGETRNGNTGKEWKGLLPPRGRHWRYDPSVLDELDREGLIEWSSTGNPRKIIYAKQAQQKGKRVQDIWEFKDPPYPCYPTEKNPDLLKRIIETSSNPGDTVFDCFCGSGTTILAAEKLGRRWIAIDESQIAIDASRARLAPEDNSLFDLSPEYVYMEEKRCVVSTEGPLK